MRGLAGRSIAKLGEVGQWLEVELEQRVGAPGHGVVPAAREPAPGDIFLVEAVADHRVTICSCAGLDQDVMNRSYADQEEAADDLHPACDRAPARAVCASDR